MNLQILKALIHKEFASLRRDVHGLLALFVLPMVFIVVMSMALKDVYAPGKKTLVWATHGSSGSQALALLERWQLSHGKRVALPTDWQAQLRHGKLAYVLEFHALADVALSGQDAIKAPAVRLLADPGIDAGALQSLSATLEGEAQRLRARNTLAAITEKALPESGEAETLSQTLRLGAGPRPTAVQQNVPAWLVFGMFFVIATIAGLFVEERRCGALARLTSLGVSPGVLIAAKVLPYLVVNAVQARQIAQHALVDDVALHETRRIVLHFLDERDLLARWVRSGAPLP